MTDPGSTPALRAVLFDAVGTLLHLREPVGDTYARAGREHRVDISAWRIGDAFARILAGAPPMVFPSAAPEVIAGLERDWWRAIVRSTLRAADSSAVLDDFDAYFGELFEHFATADAWSVAEGATDCLTALRERGLATGVISNFDLRLERVLAATGLAPHLDVVVLPGHVGAAKPDPAPFQHALAQLGCRPAEALYVGDDPKEDEAAARAAGLAAMDVDDLATLADLPARIADRTE